MSGAKPRLLDWSLTIQTAGPIKLIDLWNIQNLYQTIFNTPNSDLHIKYIQWSLSSLTFILQSHYFIE